MFLQRKWFCLLVALVATIFVSGCINFTYKTEINPNGSGKRTIDIALDKNFQSLLESTTAKKDQGSFEEQTKKNLPEGGKLRTYTKGDKAHYEISFKFDSIKDLQKTTQQMSKGSSQGPQASQVNLSRKDYLLFATYTFSEKFPASDEDITPSEKKLTESLAKIFSLDYKLKMPGKFTSSNADEIKEGTATWHLNVAEGGEVKATSRYIRWWAVILVLIFLLLLLVILIAMGIAAARRKKTPPAKPETQT